MDLQKFLSSKVINYSVYASVYKLFEYNDISPVEKTESHFNLVEHVTTSNKTNIQSSLAAVLPKDKDLRIITYQTLLEKFNAKHSNLNYPQKSLLRAYINNISNTNSLREFLNSEVAKIKRILVKLVPKINDKVSKIKITEASNQIDKLIGTKTRTVKDKNVLTLMRYYELIKELRKVTKQIKKKVIN